MNSSSRVQNRLKYWKTQLIDTSKRNRLLYFETKDHKPPPTSTVKLTEPTLQEIYDRLVEKEQPFKFYPVDKDENLLDFDDNGSSEFAQVSRPSLRTDEVRSNLTDKRLWRTLYSLRQKSRTSLQEQGIVTLFLAFGFLEWTEAQSSDIPVRSPLVLVPIQLIQESSRDTYHLALFEDEITVNPILNHMLNTNFGLTLPELPEEGALNLDAFFQAVNQAICTRLKWAVISEAYLGLFSFHKLSMYKDLEAHADRAGEHPIVRALAGDASRLPEIPDGLPTVDDLDRVVNPLETFQVLDADSSQQEAIQAAKRGVSFVLQGPPGTGKTQTIANIIAERIADGKKVLFVSEKMVALNMVYDRLMKTGLGEFCLQAHSHKANKKEVIQQLGRALDPIRPTTQSEPNYTEFSNLKKRLNSYVSALHIVRQPLNHTVYQAHGELARLLEAPDFGFEFAQIEKVTPSDITRINGIIAELVRLRDVIANYNNKHPWFGVRITEYSPNQMKSDIRAHFGALIPLLTEAKKIADEAARVCGVVTPSTLSKIERLIVLATLVKDTPRPPVTWFLPDAPTPLIEAAKRYHVQFTDYHLRRNAVLKVYEPEVFELPHSELIPRLREHPAPLLDRVLQGAKPATDTLIYHREALQQNLEYSAELLGRLVKSAPALAVSCGLDAPFTIAGIIQICKAAEWVVRNPKPLEDWFSRIRLIELKTQTEEAKAYYRAYQEEREQLNSRFQNTFLSLDVAELYSRFTGSYASPLRWLNPKYYRDLKQILAELKVSGKLTYNEATRDIKMARQVLERKQWIDARKEEHIRAFGRHYNGIDTRWDDVLNAVETVRQLVDYLGESRIPDALKQLLIESAPTLESVEGQRSRVQAELVSLEQYLASLQRILSLQGLPFTNKPLREADLGELKSWIEDTGATLSDFLVAWDTVSACQKKVSPLSERSVAEVVQDLQETRHLVSIATDVQNHAEELRVEFGHLFTGMDTRWEEVLVALDWTGRVLEWFSEVGKTPPPTFVSVVSGQQSGVEQIPEMLTSLIDLRRRIDEEMVFIHNLFRIENQPFAISDISNVCEWLQFRLDRLTDLDKWVEFQSLRIVCEKEGLSAYLGLLLREKPTADKFSPAFYKRFWSLWLDKVYQTDPVLRSFDGQRHEEVIARFRELDRSQLRMAQSRLRVRLLSNRPTVGNGSKPTGEMSTLLRENAKKSRHKPLRRLFGEIPNLLVALKPCLLMSPLSVATFLDPSVVEFDTVIFDEASQICSEDAVGAIMRGKQTIVVGDRKQLPPTQFFAADADGDYDTEDEEEEVATESYESILDECTTIGLPQWMLLWHYRSRCEALIAFSNHHFYEGKLVTFPSPHVPNALSADRCVEFVYVPEGVYTRGKGQEAGTNRLEARKVAELVLQHFQSTPSRSLGVIAFSERQQKAIDDELRRLSNLHPEYEPFFADKDEEPFFLKNLENVQGDERDTIIFSIGYGRDIYGKLSMNFGPLNKKAGERRLNVAVTRAKYRVTLVSSMQPYDIDLTRTEKKGPALLKNYMEYAQQGISALARQIDISAEPEFDSPFEEEVCLALEQKGFTVHRQIGCAGYRIDLAILDAEHPGRYLLGIECDGATYHSSKSARDRDRLRQQILEEMGWRGRILRIWSSDWIQNREAQVARVVQAVENSTYAPETPLPMESRGIVLKEPEVISSETVELTESVIASAPPFRGLEVAPTLPKEVAPYQAYRGEQLGAPENFYQIAEYKPERITDILVSVVQQEGPIHIAEATRRVVSCWGMAKAGVNLLRAVQISAERAQKRGEIAIRGEFLWSSEMAQAVVRVPTIENAVRSIEHISLEEITEACILCIRPAYAIQQNELITEVARLLGYNRTGVKVQGRISEAIAFAIEHGKIEMKEGAVTIKVV